MRTGREGRSRNRVPTRNCAESWTLKTVEREHPIEMQMLDVCVFCANHR